MTNTNIPDKNKLRRLKQYSNMTDEEYEVAYEDLIADRKVIRAFDDRVLNKKLQFSKDYDLTDLKFNDTETLDSMLKALVTLEDLEESAHRLRQLIDTDDQAINKLNRISQVISATRADISRFQEDLHITRKIRKGEKEESVLAYIEKLHSKAKEFSNAKFVRVFCPNCHMLIGTAWTLYEDSKKNKVIFHCNRDDGNGNKCDTIVTLGYKELVDMGRKNIEDVPEF